ncbi:uncharacterized protein LY89DRAFT_599986 [Mollisia scopiformis]|uniref:AB hydrolase-1 domain-containing protein n=1 Tax=Mollisia scopiformis TaxID=149040 RepID=A0A132B771_MOLSC|nr:uncharacterized protein LY89DRAFT_599986 [Mollisia scopiformis]KUJ08252.1 hypothetical protein LY89DRAFT_599986 [Mollisia scopiformis]
MIPVTVTANNTLLPIYPNSTSPTAFYEYFGSLNFSRISPFANTVSGTFNISATYCEPSTNLEGRNAVQLLVHGVAYTKSYWNGNEYPDPEFAGEYSWVSHAQSQGYATLSIDRLGNGASSHPDPINVVQGPLQVEILHQLTQSLRAGTIPSISQIYKTVILASHSYGSILGRSLATLHPTTGADAYILTAAGPDVEKGFEATLPTFHARAASHVDPLQFDQLPQGYLSIHPPSLRTSLYSYPGDFSPGLLAYDETLTHIFAAGEVIAQAPLESSPSNFTGPVFVLTGRYDQIACGVGNFTASVAQCNISEIGGLKTFFPKAKSFEVYIPDQTGHNLNTHFSAGESFGVVGQWLDNAGF